MNLAVIGYGTLTHLHQVTWVAYGKDKSDLPEQYCHSCRLDDESLRTLMVEVEGIVNCRPLTSETINDVNSVKPLCPMNILTMNSKVVLPPPGEFPTADQYAHSTYCR